MVERLDPISLPLYLQQPRRKIPAPIGLSPQVIARRAVHAQQLLGQIANLIARVQTLTPEQLKAVFVKVEHDAPVGLSGTGLKAIIQHDGKETLAVVQDDLNRLTEKISQYGTGPLRRGFPPNAEMAHLQAIRELGPKDRLSESLYEKYDSLVSENHLVLEIEMISLATGRTQRRNDLADKLRKLTNRLGNGVYGNVFEHETDGRVLRAVIRCTGPVFKELVEAPSWQDLVFWFDEKPLFETFHERWANVSVENLAETVLPDGESPVVCVIDSGINDQNFFLKGTVVAERSFVSARPNDASDEFGHGSGVASLAAYHRLDLTQKAVNRAKAWVANARILNDHNEIDDRLLSVVLREVVEHFVALGIRIFNLSVGILNRKWNTEGQRTVPRKSWVARTIDVLSREYDVVFVVSAGNIPRNSVTSLHQAEPYPRYLLYEEARILDPAQAALAITVGSLSGSTQLVAAPMIQSMAERYEPSPFTRSGPGLAGAIKPEVVELAGNMGWDNGLNRAVDNRGLAVVVANNAITPLAKMDYGTSYATPMVAHRLALILQEFRRLEEPGACLLRALLVHSARIPHESSDVIAELDQVRSRAWLNVFGHGMPDESRVVESLDHRAVLYYQSATEQDTDENMVKGDQVLFFHIPLPQDFAASGGRKRITITAAYAPRVQSLGIKTYLATKLKWRLYPGHVDREQVIEYLSAAIDDEHEGDAPERPEEIRCSLGVQRRSRGTVQHDWYEWEPNLFDQPDSFTLAVVLQNVWANADEAVAFALVITIEDESGRIPLYQELRNQIDDIRVQTRGRGR